MPPPSGPLPLVWNDIIVDEVQIAQASVARADGVTLLLGVLGGERAAALAAAAATYGLAVFTQVAFRAASGRLGARARCAPVDPSLVAR